METVPELYVVGTQESTGQLKEWEVLVQQTLGPSHLLLSSSSLGELTVLLFLRRDLIWFCSGQLLISLPSLLTLLCTNLAVHANIMQMEPYITVLLWSDTDLSSSLSLSLFVGSYILVEHT